MSEGKEKPIIDIYPFKVSPQLRRVAAGETVQIPLAKPQKALELLLTQMDVITFSEQGDQDLIVSLRVNERIYYQSGYMAPSTATPPFDRPYQKTDTRVNSDSGGPYNRVAKDGDTGRPDNWMPGNRNITAYARGNETVIFAVQNQSDVYDHSVMVGLEGMYILRED